MRRKARMGSAVPRGRIGPPITSRKGLTTMAIRLVVFDVGETLIDECRMWGEWADWLGVPRLTFFAALGAVIAAKQHHNQVFELVCPGIDLAREREARRAQRLHPHR